MKIGERQLTSSIRVQCLCLDGERKSRPVMKASYRLARRANPCYYYRRTKYRVTQAQVLCLLVPTGGSLSVATFWRTRQRPEYCCAKAVETSESQRSRIPQVSSPI